MKKKRVLKEIVGSDEAYLIFGGPSLRGFDLSNLDDYFTLACNKCAEEYNATAVISIDPTYINTRKDFLRDYDGYVMIARRETKPNSGVIDHINPNWLYWHDKRFPHLLSEDPNVLYGTNTGQAAINALVLHGFKTIHCLGLDLSVVGHWHGGYSHSRQHSHILYSWARYIDGLKPQLDEKGVRLINYNFESGVRDYEFGNLRDLIRGAA